MRNVSQSVLRNSGAGCKTTVGFETAGGGVVEGLMGPGGLPRPAGSELCPAADCALAGGVLPLSLVIYSNALSNKTAGEHTRPRVFHTAPSPGENSVVA